MRNYITNLFRLFRAVLNGEQIWVVFGCIEIPRVFGSVFSSVKLSVFRKDVIGVIVEQSLLWFKHISTFAERDECTYS